MAANGWPGAQVMLWIMLAMLGIWCAAMTYNRIADRAQDAANPRTAHRILPSGKLSLIEAGCFCAAGGALFLNFLRWRKLGIVLLFFALIDLINHSAPSF